MKHAITKTGLLILISDIDADLARHPWSYVDGYAVQGGKLIHRVVMARMLGIKFKDLKTYQQVDHINRNPLDNQRHNLRLATHTQNGYNTGPRRGDRYKGVTYNQITGKFKAVVVANAHPI